MVEEMNNEMAEFKSLSVGDLTKGTVAKVEDKQAFVNVGYKMDGVLPISELSSLHVEKVDDVLKEGEEHEFKVIKLTEEELVLSKKAVVAEKAWDDIEKKLESGDTFEAEVADVVKGGLVVDVGVRGFIPASLVERHYVEDFADYKGKMLRLKVVEMDREKNKLILSQRAVLDEEVNEKKKETLSSVNEGEIIEGTVQRLTSFGAFVDIGGVDGLVHISQMAHHHVEQPSDVVSEGDTVKVKVLGVDPDNERISLSIKDTLPGPWELLEGQIQPGQVIKGTVRRLVSFGAFIEVAPGVEGLVHISQIANRHIGTPGEVLKENEEVSAKVLDVNTKDKRISLSIRALEEEKEAKAENEAKQEYEKDDDHGGFSLGDVIGDQLKKYKN
ncbi:30S ribosomal protein S1 [Salipaludibacillus agaradhaerens]|jgi:small subunit ribosomal protein S1|uniref:30S ribosomal protein S1 n=1 Tax=Salipaludibacillus agaradhaerens TaxID=76935 RepID=UPI002151BBB7|nr:30S ribosomal protein S1 [Salipaludibacillus agaradhaerens]MCR6106559.1 30S ribosomal protein S1 [Salipaludibacillus agaradhaerens]MCR6118592.1 30S ribosomal protein S1 [Salipaludibacillus agaradhaerens]UJW57680.1 30S ribosomal protein S1 [Bacillus sp. A116_S68]